MAHGVADGGGGGRTQLLVVDEVAELKRPRFPIFFSLFQFGFSSAFTGGELLSTAAQDGSRGGDEEGCGG